MKKRYIFLIAVVGVFIILYFVVTRDSPPFDDSVLHPNRLDIPDEENGFTYINFSVPQIYYPGDDREKSKLYDDMTGWRIWDEELAEEAYQHNKDALILLDKALEQKHFQVPAAKDWNTPLPYLAEWRGLARYMSIRARQLQKQGNEKDAFDMAIKIVEFAERIENSKGVIITYLVGNSVRAIGLGALSRLLEETELESQLLKEYANELYKKDLDGRALSESLKVEYITFNTTIRLLVSGEIKLSGIEGFLTRSGYSLKPRKTRKILFQLFTVLVENAVSNYDRQTDIYSLPVYIECFSAPRLSPNFAGRSTAVITIPSLERCIEKKFQWQTKTRFTQVLIALKAYKLENGDLPGSLDELVPEYIDRIPLDPYDGKQIRYSKENKIIWSVGVDRIDDGGYIIKEDVDIETRKKMEYELFQYKDPTEIIKF